MIKLQNSKRMLNGGGGKIGFANLLVVFFSLGLFSCNNSYDDAETHASVPMTVQVSNSLFAGGSRALITDEYITSGSIGVTLVDDGGVDYDDVTYSNLQYTYADGAWGPASGVTTPPLTATVGKAAAYYPFVADVPVTAVPVTIAEQQDVLYSGWVSDISVAKPEALFHMQHALAAVRVVLKKDATYVPSATATEVTVTSDDFYPTATLDATSGDLTPTGEAGATVTSGTGSWAVTTGGTGVDLLVIPGGVAQKITFSATIGGKKYTATTPAAVTLGRALIHTYTLTLSAQGLTVGVVSVEPWGSGVTGSLTLAPVIDPWDNLANGVYAVAADGTPVDVASADESCIAVALVVGEHQFWIEKNETNNTTSIKAAYTEDGATNTSYTYFYWGMSGSDNTSITNYTQTGGGGTSLYGYLPQANGSYASSSNNLSGDYTTWTSGALSDFNGKANTAALLAASDTDSYTTYANMATWCRIFNQTATENQGYTDWYIPACGQLSLMYLNMTAINNALTKIGGQTIASDDYWSSSEHSSNYGRYVYFGGGYVNYYSKENYTRVRFVRDF